jgi:hypothetical protein
MFINMLNNIKNSACLFIVLISVNVSAAILDKGEVDKADLNLLQDETVVFQSIGMGIALSIAQCEGVDLCSLTVEEGEIQELINTLDARIEGLVLKQEEVEDPVGFGKVLTAYINERENYATHLEKLKNITSTLDVDSDLLDDSLELESEAADFPVDSARNEELLDYLNELDAFDDEELKDDEDLEDLPDLPELE